MPNLLLNSAEKKKRFKQLLDRELPAAHVTLLRTYCGIRDEEGVGGQADLPPKVVEEYWKYKMLRDRGGDSSAFATFEFILICRFAEQHEEMKEADFARSSLIDLWHAKRLKKDDPIMFKVGRIWVDGTIRGLTGGGKEIVVIQLGDSQQKVMKPQDVRLKDHEADGAEQLEGELSDEV